MDRQKRNSIVDALKPATDSYLAIDAEIVSESKKALCLATMKGAHEVREWFPKSQLAQAESKSKAFDKSLAVKRSWVGMKNLWSWV